MHGRAEYNAPHGGNDKESLATVYNVLPCTARVGAATESL